jgi:hypothetical protein
LVRRIRAAEQQNNFFIAFLCTGMAKCFLAFFLCTRISWMRWRHWRWRNLAIHVLVVSGVGMNLPAAGSTVKVVQLLDVSLPSLSYLMRLICLFFVVDVC